MNRINDQQRFRDSLGSLRRAVSLRAMLINIEGEKNLSLHEPIGIGIIAARLKKEIPEVEIKLYDTQNDLVRTGKIDTDVLVRKIVEFADSSDAPFLLGISVPIFSWDYTKSLLIKLEHLPKKNHMTIVLGNSIPTYTDTALIKKEFPDVKIVKGEGEEIFYEIARRVMHNQPIEEVYDPQLPNFVDYVVPYRGITTEISKIGGSVKVETSRGCDYGWCTMCSRCTERGDDYRTVPELKVVETIKELVHNYGVRRFELTDEEAFADIEATKRLIKALRESGLPRIPFSASTRVDVFNKLKIEGMIHQLQGVGLDKIFLGVEGGSDGYLNTLGKKQKMVNVYEAIEAAKQFSLDYEIGFITFSWRMSFEMLKQNIRFMSEGDNIYHISSMANKLEIRSGTRDEEFLRNLIRNKKIIYDIEEGYSINDSAYKNVPFLDKRVGRIYERLNLYFKAEANLTYSIKSLMRAKSLEGGDEETVRQFYNSLISLGLRMMMASVGFTEKKGIVEERRQLIRDIYVFFQNRNIFGVSDIVKREALIFLKEESERNIQREEHIGAMLVISDGENRILLVRPRFDELWAFPGGGVNEDEGEISAAIREGKEELGSHIDIHIFGKLPDFVKEVHRDNTTGKNERLILHHYAASLNNSTVNIMAADHEIADILWLTPKEILEGRIKVRENVFKIVEAIQNGM